MVFKINLEMIICVFVVTYVSFILRKKCTSYTSLDREDHLEFNFFNII